MLYPFWFLLVRSIVVEGAVVVAGLWRRRPLWATAAAIVAVNLMTHPIGAELIFRHGWNIWIAELLIPIAEGVGYRYALRLGWGEAMALSFVANVTSFLFGIIVG